MSRVLNTLKQRIKPGEVYRRTDLESWTTSVDRHLHMLTADGTLKKLSHGLYYAPKETKFGVAPPDDGDLVKRFLKDDAFLLVSPNAYNSLGFGTTQLYNTTWVYNHKRRGVFKLGGKKFEFKLKSSFPKQPSAEYLVVDLLNNLDNLAEDSPSVVANLGKMKNRYDSDALESLARQYGNGNTRKLVRAMLKKNSPQNA